jgi:hypothetical protein
MVMSLFRPRRGEGRRSAGHGTLLAMANYGRRDGDPRVAELLRGARRLHRLTIEQAARLVPCSVGMWSMLEHARRRPSTVMAGAIADALKLPDNARELLMDAALPGVGRDSPYKLAAALRRR